MFDAPFWGEHFGHRAGGKSFDGARKNKHRIFLNLEQNKREVPVREKIAARARLVDWLKEQDVEGEQFSGHGNCRISLELPKTFQSSCFWRLWCLPVDLLMKLSCNRLTVPAEQQVYGFNQP